MNRFLLFIRRHWRWGITVLGVLLLVIVISLVTRGRGAPSLLGKGAIFKIMFPIIGLFIINMFRSRNGGAAFSMTWAYRIAGFVFIMHVLTWAWQYPHWLVATAGWPWFTAALLIALTFVAGVLAVLWVVFRQKYLPAAGVFAAIMLVWTATHQFVGGTIRYDVRDGDQIIKWCQVDGEAFYGERLDFKACPKHGKNVFVTDPEKLEVWYCPTDNTAFVGTQWANRSVPRGDEFVLLEHATPAIRRQLEKLGAIVHGSAGYLGDMNPQNFTPKQKSAWATLMAWTFITLGVFGVGWGLMVFLTAIRKGGSHHA